MMALYPCRMDHALISLEVSVRNHKKGLIRGGFILNFVSNAVVAGFLQAQEMKKTS